MSEDIGQQLQKWLSFRELSLAEVEARFAPSGMPILPNAGYAGLGQLTQVGDFDTAPGLFYFRDEQFVLFYVDEMSDELEEMSLSALLDYLGEPTAVLRARSGKRHRQYVYAEMGIALAGVDDEIAFLEIFPPKTLADYKAELYVEPPRFIR